MRYYQGRWCCQGRSWATLHEALLAVWPRGKKKTAHGTANTEGGKGEKGLRNPYFTLIIPRDRGRRKDEF